MNATAAAPTTHDEWIAVMNNSVSEFAATMISDSRLAEAKAGDFYAREYVAGEAQYFIRLEAKSNVELAAELIENETEHYRVIADEDQWEIDVNDYEEFSYRQHVIHSLLEHRAAIARYTAREAGLVYNPFAELLKLYPATAA